MQNCLACYSKVTFVLSQARYSLDTTMERKLSPGNPLPCSIYTHTPIQELHRCTACRRTCKINKMSDQN